MLYGLGAEDLVYFVDYDCMLILKMLKSKGLFAMASLCTNNREVTQMFIKHDAITVTIFVMQRYSGNSHVQEAGCSALSQMSSSSHTSSSCANALVIAEKFGESESVNGEKQCN